MIFLAARNFSGERLNSSRFLVQWLTTEFIFTQSFAALKIVKLQFLFGMINSNLYPISFSWGRKSRDGRHIVALEKELGRRYKRDYKRDQERIEMLGRRRHSKLEGLKRKKRSLEQLLRHFTETEVFNIYACVFANSIRIE